MALMARGSVLWCFTEYAFASDTLSIRFTTRRRCLHACFSLFLSVSLCFSPFWPHLPSSAWEARAKLSPSAPARSQKLPKACLEACVEGFIAGLEAFGARRGNLAVA